MGQDRTRWLYWELQFLKLCTQDEGALRRNDPRQLETVRFTIGLGMRQTPRPFLAATGFELNASLCDGFPRNSRRLSNSHFLRMLETWNLTVRSVMCSALAISLLETPSRRKSMICRSRGVTRRSPADM